MKWNVSMKDGFFLYNSVKMNSNNQIHSHTWKCNVTLLESLQLLYRTNRPLALAALHFF